MATRGRLLRKLAITLGVLLGALVLLEIGARGWLRWRGAPWDGVQARAQIEEIRSRLEDDLPLPAKAARRQGRRGGSKETLHPYLGFEGTNGPPAFARLLRVSRKDGFRVLVLGGSVAAIFTNLGRERFAELLEADPRLHGRDVSVIPLARAAFKQPQSYLYLAWAVSMGVKPDAVVLLDGFNEVSMGYSNATRGLHPNFPSSGQWLSVAQAASSNEELLEGWAVLRQRKQAFQGAIQAALDAPVWRSALVGHLLRRWVLGRQAEYSRALGDYSELMAAAKIEPALLGPPFKGTAADGARAAADCWLECSRLTQALCDSLDVPYLHVLQPTLYDPDSKPRSPEEQAIAAKVPSWVPGVELGYPILREMGVRLGGEGVAFLDASGLFAEVEETLYYDVCHFGESGNRRLAEVIAPALLELLEQPR